MVQLWKRWCRLCARENHNNTHINLFFKEEQQSPLSDTINKCFDINLTYGDDWPQTICERCHQLITLLTEFTQRTFRVQRMFAELYNSLEELDPIQLKVHYELQELDDPQLELKLFDNSPEVQIFESKPPVAPATNKPLIDLDELEYIEDDVLNSTAIKTEKTDDESVNVNMNVNVNVNEVGGKEQDESPAASADEDTDEYNSPKSEAESEEEEEEEAEEPPKKRRRGRPRKFQYKKAQRKATNFACEECDKSFSRLQDYRYHMRTDHGVVIEPKQYPCTKCNKTFPTARRLEDHEVIHLPMDQKLIFPCPHCGKKFTKSRVVQLHIRTVHIGGSHFICEECGKAYKTFGSLKEHKVLHTDAKPFQCPFCDKTFKTNARLKIHEDTHNETNYICPTCGLQLNTRRTLKMHMVVHSDQKRHKCDYCGNEYKRAKALKNHLILHTGLKPYTCNFCEKSFANGSNCRTHKKKSHPVELAAMEAAGKKSITTNIPKLEQLRAVTSNKSVTIQPFERDQDFAEEEIQEKPSDIVHVVFGSVNSVSTI